AGVGPQPFHALLDDAGGLPHLGHADQVAVVAVAVDADRDVELDLGVLRVRLLLAQVPGHARTTQHRAGHAPGQRLLGRDHADADGALLPDAVVGEQGLVLVDAVRELLRKDPQVVQHRTFACLVETLELAALAPRRLAVP